RGAPGPCTARLGPVVAAGGAGLLALTGQLVVAMLAVLLVGVGTSMTTARLMPRFADATPETMLARFWSFLQLAQIAPVLVATPVLGWFAHRWSVDSALLVVAGVLLVTAFAVHRADAGLTRAALEDRPARVDAFATSS
ncbi:MAG: hypothetical protein QM638_22545, partial [Nocardioides sp.]|uniref:hypothetical protein n=1 Tax=Nocardioides sp. TaxID=35761 RepID=UPI0039E63F6B